MIAKVDVELLLQKPCCKEMMNQEVNASQKLLIIKDLEDNVKQMLLYLIKHKHGVMILKCWKDAKTNVTIYKTIMPFNGNQPQKLVLLSER